MDYCIGAKMQRINPCFLQEGKPATILDKISANHSGPGIRVETFSHNRIIIDPHLTKTLNWNQVAAPLIQCSLSL